MRNRTMDPIDPIFLKLTAAAIRFGFSKKRLRDAEAAGDIRFYRVNGGRENYVKTAEVRRYADAAMKPKKTPPKKPTKR